MGCEGLPTSIVGCDHCVVVVIDVQNDACAAGGAFARDGSDLSRIAEMLSRLHQFLEETRGLGVTVAFVRHEYDPASLPEFLARRDKAKWGSDARPCFEPGSWGAEFCKPIEPAGDEPVFTKHYYSAFSSNSFVRFLRQSGASTLVLTGVLTNVCVETTARDAELWGFYTIVAEDCVASDSQTLHEAALANLETYFGWTCRGGDLVRLWEAQRSGRC
jgi:ureidoacrylate peracid hydrolase